MPTIIDQPNVNLNILSAIIAAGITPHKVLIVGAKTGAGSATAGALVQEIQNDGSEDTLFGARSMLAGMIRDFKKLNPITQVDAIGLDDNAGGALATGTITIVGTATEDGVLTFTIGSRENRVYQVPVADTDTETTIAANLVAAITADTTAPFTAANVAGVVTITAANKGTEANFIGFEYSGEVAGITSITLVQMSGGTLNPVLTTVFDVVDGIRYQTVAWPGTWDIDTLTDFLDARFNVDNAVLDGVGCISRTDTFANHSTWLDSRNSQSLVAHMNRTEIADADYKGSSLFELDTSIAAQFAAVRSLRLTAGANISRYLVSTVAANDNVGGPAIGSLPYYNTSIPTLPLCDQDKGWSDTQEIENLKAKGGFFIGNNSAGTEVIVGEVVTTYKTTTSGQPDLTWEFLNTVDTMSLIREYMFNNLKSTYAMSRLTNGSLVPQRTMANETKVRGSLIGYNSDLSKGNFVLIQAGEESREFFIQNLNVTVTLQSGTVQFSCQVLPVGQLRNLDGSVRPSFSIDQSLSLVA